LFNRLGDFFVTVLKYAFSEKKIFRPIVTLKKNDRLILSDILNVNLRQIIELVKHFFTELDFDLPNFTKIYRKLSYITLS